MKRRLSDLDAMILANCHLGNEDDACRRRAALRRLLQERDGELMRRLDIRDELQKARDEARRLFREERRGYWDELRAPARVVGADHPRSRCQTR